MLLCDHNTGCEAYSFATDGYGISRLRTLIKLMRAAHTKGGQAQTSLHKHRLVGTGPLTLTLPRQGIGQRDFGLEVGRANYS